ncbi:unnamed protein product [Blepharisma stoltei]|uniref:GAIN-B domain-containing protein n=1 Tax=Blepharisma stoltei TaxID=1481888 RepID=A0AAU9K2M3_9CILI|nr:unnamed protein product [Blepharisma stoltei]
MLGDTYTLVSDFDIFVKAGPNNAYDIFVEFLVVDGASYVDGNLASDSNNYFIINFINSGIGDPTISGIVLVKGYCSSEVDNCNMCYDDSCYDCDETTITCNACNSNMTPVNGICQCNSQAYYKDSKSHSCFICDYLCEVCEGSGKFLCNSCYSPNYLVSQICLKSCPYGFSTGCSEVTSILINSRFNSDFTGVYDGFFRSGTFGNSYYFFNSPDADDPIPAFNRGLYFRGLSTFLETTFDVYFSINFSLAFWIWIPEDSSASEGIMKHGKDSKLSIYSNGNIYFFLENEEGYLDYIYTDPMSVNYGTWIYFSYTIFYSSGATNVKSFMNNAPMATNVKDGYIYRGDFEGNTIVLGLDRSSNHFRGFIYAFQFWNCAVSDFSAYYLDDLCGTGNIASCLWSCALEEWMDNSVPTFCDASCNYGCVRNGSCNICFDPLCKTCHGFNADSCDQCVANASGSSCSCNSPYIVSNSGFECVSCSSGCESCTGENPYDCISCNPGYYQLKTWCITDDSNYHTPNSCIASYEFTKISNIQYDSVNSYPIYMGSDDLYYNDYDANDPWVLPYRGLYFNGNSIALLPQKNETSKGIPLWLNHTIDIWVMAMPSYSAGAIYSLYTDDSYLIIITAPPFSSPSSHKYEVWYNLTNFDGQSSGLIETQSAIYLFNTWQRVVVSYSYQSESNLKLFVNDQMVDSKTESNYFYYEHNFKAYLGKEVMSGGFVGYIYSLKLYNYAMQSVTSWSSTSCGYPFCTESNIALINCKPLEFYDISTKSCNYCSSYCLHGCARGGDICNLHQNPLCESYENLKFEVCGTCKANANNIPPCTCADNLIYDTASETCKCSDGYQPVNNQCSSCIRYLQPSEIKGYFTLTFLKIIFEFSIAVDISGLKCSNIFPTTILDKFGLDYSCSLDSDKITVELGKDFAIRDESVSLIKGSLKCGNECGYTANNINIALQYSSAPPFPLSIIDAPNTVLYNCQDLLISGQKSTGNLNSALEYKWILSSDPPLQALIQFNTDFQTQISYFSIPRSDLSTANITVTLMVRNILGSVGTNSIVIQSIPNGISVNFDRAISNQQLVTKSNFYAAGSIASCDDISELHLSWKLESADGNLTAVDEESIWENQKWPSSLYIPAKSIPPYTNVTFVLQAANLVSNIKGVGLIEISVFPSSPVIQFSRTDGDAEADKPFSIDASSSYDPNENKPLSFVWNCIKSNSIDCSSLISDPYSPILRLPSNSLETGTEYAFSVAAIADFSNGRQGKYSMQTEKTIKISAVSYHVPDLNIINAIPGSQSNTMSGDKKLSLAVSVESDPNKQLSYQWSLVSGGNLKFTTPLDQYAIAISQDSLNAGITYTLNLAIFDGSHYSSFFYSFYANSPPSLGSLDTVPDEGIELDTIFKMEALGWIDEENDYPFDYSFGYLTDNNSVFLNIKNQSSTHFTAFPYLSRSTLSIFVDVYDSLGALSRKIEKIKVSKNKNLDKNELYLSSQNYVYSITSNPQTYPATIGDLCSSILNRDYYTDSEFKYPSDDDKVFLQEVVNSTLYWTKSLIEKGNLDSQSISTFADLLRMVTFNPYLVDHDVETKVLEMINSIADNIPESQTLTNEQTDDYFIAIDQSYQYNASSLVNKTDSLEKGVDTINNLNKLILSQMVINEKIFITTDNIEATLTVMESKDLDDFQLYSSSKSASVALPSNFSSILASSTSESEVGIAMTLLKAPKNPDSLSSSVVDFSIYDRQSNQKIELNMTFSYILIEIPVWNLKSSAFVPQCAFLNTKSMNWSTQGCTKQQIKSESIICSCNHFTSFAAIDSAASTIINSNIGDTINVSAWNSLNESNAIGLYFGIATLIIYIILAIFTYKKDKKEEKIEEEIRKKLKGIPKKLERVINKFNEDPKTEYMSEKGQKVTNSKSPILCCKKKMEDCNDEFNDEALQTSCSKPPKKDYQAKNCEAKELTEPYHKEDKSAEIKNPFWKCCRKKQNYKNDPKDQSEAFDEPDEVYVYSFTDEIRSESTETEQIKETKIRKLFGVISEKHELFNILLTRVPQNPSLCRITLYFLVLIGQMFFIGMFYETSTSASTETLSINSTNSTSSDYSSEGFSINYSWHDFWIMAWSSLLMIVIVSILGKLFTEREITDQITGIQYLKIKRQNRIKRWIGLFLAWGIMFYFLWSIALYAIQFDEDISRVWVLNTGISYTVNILFTSVVKIAITAYLTMKLLDLIEKYKKKKTKENNEAEIHITDFQTPTYEIKTGQNKR